MGNSNEYLRNWLVARRSDEFRVFARLEWDELGNDGWTVVKEHLTEDEAVAEVSRLAAPENRG